MVWRLPDSVWETTTGTGTGSLTLAGVADPGGYRTFASLYSNGDKSYILIRNRSAAEWEIGYHAWTTGGIITRAAGDVIAGSAGAGSLVNFTSGTKDVFTTIPEIRALYQTGDELMFDLVPTSSAASGVPAAPSTNLKMFAQPRAGRLLLRTRAPTGGDYSFQSALFSNNVLLWLPSTGTGVYTALGTLWTARLAGTAGAKSTPAPASTNVYTAMHRAEFTTGTTATGSAGEQSDLQFWRGNATGLGGFFFHCRFGIGATSGTWRLLIGLSALNAALAGDPSAQANTCGLIKDSGDTNYQVATVSSTPAASKTDTGHAPSTTEVLDFFMYAAPNGSNITMKLMNALDGTVYLDDTAISTNLPTNTTMLAAHMQIMSATGTTGKILGVGRLYCETEI